MQSKVLSEAHLFSRKKYLSQFNPSHDGSLSFRGLTLPQLRSVFGEITKLWVNLNDRELITQVFLDAKRAHEFQKRKSGEDYISHPLEVGIVLYILTQEFGDKILSRTGIATKELHRLALIVSAIHDVVEDQSWYFAYKYWLLTHPEKIDEKLAYHFRVKRETISVAQMLSVLPDQADWSRYFKVADDRGLTNRYEFKKGIPDIKTDERLSDEQKKTLALRLKLFLHARNKHRQMSLEYIKLVYGVNEAKSMGIISRPNTLGLTKAEVEKVEKDYFDRYMNADRINRLMKICDFVVNSYDYSYIKGRPSKWFEIRQDKARTNYYPLLKRFPLRFRKWFKNLVELMPVH